MLKHFVEVARAVGATTKKLEKERLLKEYFLTLDDATLERAVLLLTGSPFPRKDERVTGVGWAAIVQAASEATATEPDHLAEGAIREGDVGDGLAPFFPEATDHDLSVVELAELFDQLAATQGAAAKTALLRDLFSRLNREEARLVIKILVGETRIGLQEGLLESALAKTFDQPLDALRRAHMFNGDLGATALLAKGGALESVAMTLFHPIGFMLAQPEETSSGIFAQLGAGAIADDKYDGIRAQLHTSAGMVRMFSRTLDEITDRFPEVRDAAAHLPASVILDGEIVAFSDRILPFAVLQKRIGRRKLTASLLSDAPVVFFAYDILFFGDAAILDEPLSGLDPVGRKDFIEILADYKQGGGAIFFTSHVLHDVERIADRFGFINKGQLLTVRSPRDIVTEHADRFIIRYQGGGDVLADARQIRESEFEADCLQSKLPECMAKLNLHGAKLITISPALSLENVFFKILADYSDK